MNTPVRHNVFGTLFSRFLVAVVGFFLAIASQSAQANAAAPDQSTAKYEVRFMEEMIEHHMMAIDMGKICLDKAVHQELRSLCQGIISAQQQEILNLQQWLAQWYGVANYQPEMSPGQMKQMEKLSMLNNSEFEITFMEEMIKHHKKAIVKASQCIDRAYHEALQDMCTNIVTTQLAEIQKMQEWLCTWYGICRSPRNG